MPIGNRASAGYPEAERLKLVEEIHGHRVADPYRWLEDADDPRTRDWCAQQDELFAEWQARWLGDQTSGRLRRRLDELADAGSVSVPVWRGERWFFTRRGPGQEHEVVLTVGADGAERVLIDPSAIDPSGVTTLDGWFPSPEGRLLAYLISAGGTEQSLLRVMDVTARETVDGPIDRVSRAPMAWLPGGAAFYYQRQSAPDQAGDGEGESRRLIYLHRIGTDPDRDVLVFGEGLPPAAYPFPVLSRDGRWLWLGVDWGPVRVDGYLADLRAEGTGRRFTVVQRDVDAMSFPSFGSDGRLYVLTDREAPGRRVCVVDPDHPGFGQWRTVLPEDRCRGAQRLRDPRQRAAGPAAAARPSVTARGQRADAARSGDRRADRLGAGPRPGHDQRTDRAPGRRPLRLVPLRRLTDAAQRLPVRCPQPRGDPVGAVARRRRGDAVETQQVTYTSRDGTTGQDVHPVADR